MKTYILRHGNDKFILRRKKEDLSDDFTYTESGNDITIQSYTGSDTDVKVIDKVLDNFMLVRPTIYGVDVTDYEYENLDGIIVLTQYIGSGGDIDTPEIEEI